MPIDLQELLDDSNTSVSTLNDIAKDPFSSKTTLIKLLKRENIEQEVIKNIANNPGANSDVLKKLVDHVFSTNSYSNSKENVEILITVLDNPNIELKVFEQILSYCFQYIIDEKVLIKILKHKCFSKIAGIPSILANILSFNGYTQMHNLVMEILKMLNNHESILNKLILEKKDLTVQTLNALLQDEVINAFILRNINENNPINPKILAMLLHDTNTSNIMLNQILNLLNLKFNFYNGLDKYNFNKILNTDDKYENEYILLLIYIMLHKNSDEAIINKILKSDRYEEKIFKDELENSKKNNLQISYILALYGKTKNRSIFLPLELISNILNFVSDLEEHKFKLLIKPKISPTQKPFVLINFHDFKNNVLHSIINDKTIKIKEIEQNVKQDLPNLGCKSEEEINACFLENGFKRIEVPEDENCFYNAIRLSLHANENYTVEDLRNLVADYIEDQLIHHNNETFRYAILAENHTIDSYIAAVRQSKNNILWTDNLQIIALMRILNRPIYFFNDNATPRNIEGIEPENLNDDPIFLHYNGVHYYYLTPDIKHIPKKLKM